jgi:hypothetical protein
MALAIDVSLSKKSVTAATGLRMKGIALYPTPFPCCACMAGHYTFA